MSPSPYGERRNLRAARNNTDAVLADVIDENDQPVQPGAIVLVDADTQAVRDAVEAGTLELDPTLGRHLTKQAGAVTEDNAEGLLDPRRPTP